MKWGVRRYQNSDGSLTKAGYKHYGYKNLKKAKTANLDKWGKAEDTNVLYIAGYSGSGKSTTARALKGQKDIIISLDGYSEIGAPSSIQSKRFNTYLDKNVPNWRQMQNANDKTPIKRHSKEYWKIVDDFDKAIESFGKEQYKNGSKVIVEGVQIADDWLKGNKSEYAGKPVVVLGTNPIKSMQRAFERDERGNLLKGLGNLDNAKEYITWYKNTNKRLGELEAATGANGKDFINNYMNETIKI